MSGVKIDDEYAFITEPETFCSLNASKRTWEGKRKRKMDVEYLRAAGQLHIREMDESVDPAQAQRDEVKNNIPSCVQDPFSAIYFLRRSDLRPKHSRPL